MYLETWQRERLFEYDEFTGLKESINKKGNYVTIDIENGRLVKNNPKNCEKNVFFYGGEKIFGYDVTNDQTIPYFFRELQFLQKREIEDISHQTLVFRVHRAPLLAHISSFFWACLANCLLDLIFSCTGPQICT